MVPSWIQCSLLLTWPYYKLTVQQNQSTYSCSTAQLDGKTYPKRLTSRKNQGKKKVKVISDFVSPDSTVYMVMGKKPNKLLYTSHEVLLSGMKVYLEKEMAVYSSIFAWSIQWTEEPGWLQSIGSQIVGHNWSNLEMHMHTSFQSFPGGLDGKESACNAGDQIQSLGGGRSPGEGTANPQQYSTVFP